MNDQELDRILNDMGREEPDPAEVAAARERVWHRLSAGPLCLQFRSQFDAYRDDTLDEAHRLLLEDHLARCAGCRRAFQPAAAVMAMPPAKAAPPWGFAIPRWAIAAGVAAVSLYFGRNVLDRAFAPAGPRATVESASGAFYTLRAATLANGAGIADGETIRTAAGARAHLRLADGSMVEVNERTELSIRAAWSGSTIQLERGDIIVRAAKQRRGYLKVVTRDSEAAVKGTIFTVSAGMAGSLVGVIEGSVAVSQPGTERLLKPGEQAATSAALRHLSVRDAVAWSEELAFIEKQLPAPAPRTAAGLLSLLPPDVTVYAAIPNLGPAMDQAVNLLEQRSRDNQALREWWTSPGADEMRRLLERARALAPLLGDEIVFVLAKPRVPLVMAEVKRGREAELKKLLPEGAAFRVANGVLLIAKSAEQLDALAGRLGQGANTPFAAEIQRRYARGVTWILGADVAALPGAHSMRYAFLEQRKIDGVEENEATVTFAGPRTGIASWLAAPGSAGSAEYASADAVAVFSAATRKPSEIFDELRNRMPGWADKLHMDDDLVAALGTDFTVSVETAAVPVPGWVAAVETYRPAALNAAIGRLVEAHNREVPAEKQLALKQETADGRDWYSLTMAGFGLQWTFDRGYWILAMDRAVAIRAIGKRAGGFPLIRSAAFRDRMPALTGAHPSGFAWFNLGPAASLLSSFALPAEREPTLLTINGETERIQVASRSRFTSLMMDTMLYAHVGRKRAR